jgi:CRISPR-associated protein Cmr6
LLQPTKSRLEVAFAAVPAYLPLGLLGEASPGLRFNMYLSVWGEDRQTNQKLWTTSDHVQSASGENQERRIVPQVNKRGAIDRAATFTTDDRKRNRALRERQAAVALMRVVNGDLMCIEGRSVSPFATGLGNEHPLENGFSFLNPYGLPYLPGSSVKGIMRAAAGELGWNDTQIELFFGSPPGHDEDCRRGVLAFWDVFPEIRGDRLMVEVMTPHQTHYHAAVADGTRVPGTDGRRTISDSPHDSGDPNPIFFLTVPPESLFSFYVQCDRGLMKSFADSGGRAASAEVVALANLFSSRPERWKEEITPVFDHAFGWVGFGAKTSVGYGALERNKEEQSRFDKRVQQEHDRMTAASVRAGKSAAQLVVADFVAWCTEREVLQRGRKTPVGAEPFQKAAALARLAAEGSWLPGERIEAAQAIESWGPRLISIDVKDLRKKLKLAVLRGNP